MAPKRSAPATNGSGSPPRLHKVAVEPETVEALHRARMTGEIPTIGEDDLRQVVMALNSAIASRADLLSRVGPDSRRDYFKEFGHPKNPSIKDYADLYDRCGIAARAVKVWPRECWQSNPMVYERERLSSKRSSLTVFEQGLQALADGLGGTGLFRSATASVLWQYLERLDIQCGIGPYGVLLFGTDDGLSLDTPAAGIVVNGSHPLPKGETGPKPKKGDRYPAYSLSINAKEIKGRKLNYLRVFPARFAEITTFELNRASPRYMQPTEYLLTMMGNSDTSGDWGESEYTERVHWTRVLHVADNVESNEVYGTPRLQHSYNRHLDLTKTYGGSAEMFWLSAVLTLVFNPQAGRKLNVPATRETIERFMNGLQRYLSFDGVDVNSISPGISDPRPVIESQLDAICIEKEVPKRIFTGSERGQLASDQDESNQNDRVHRRRNNFVTPAIVVPFVNRCITLGCLPAPTQYYVEWPDITASSANEQADRLVKRTGAMGVFLDKGLESLMTVRDYLVREMDYTEEEAEEILKAKEEEEKEEELEEREPEETYEPWVEIDEGKARAEALAKGVSAGAHTLFSRKDFFIEFLGFSPERADEMLKNLEEERRVISPEEQALYEFASARLLGGAKRGDWQDRGGQQPPTGGQP